MIVLFCEKMVLLSIIRMCQICLHNENSIVFSEKWLRVYGGWDSRCCVAGIWYRLCLHKRKQSGTLAMVLTDWIFPSLLSEALLFSRYHSSRGLVNPQRASSSFLHFSRGCWTLAGIRFAGGLCSILIPGPDPQRVWHNRSGGTIRNLWFSTSAPGDSVSGGFLSATWEALAYSLFPFFVSSPPLCQCCGALQKERSFWRWGSHLISHDFLLVVGSFH